MNALAAHGGPKTVDLPAPHYQWPIVDASLEKAILDQAHRSLSDRDATGIIGEYERAFASFLGVGPGQVVSMASGTAAIHAMSRVAGLSPGDAVLAPAYTFLATASPFAFDGVEVVFCDADPSTGNVTAQSLAARMQPNVKAVIVTHMWGIPCPMDEIAAFCADHGLILMEDCSHAHFASWDSRPVGTWGDMAVFSTNQKAITTGEGGIFLARETRLRELAVLYAHYNKRSLTEIDPAAEHFPFAFTGMGLKERMTTLGAAIGMHQLGRADQVEARRRQNLDALIKTLDGNPVIAPVTVPPERGEHGLYVFGLLFHPDQATVTRDEFVRLCVAEGALDVDAPGSTRDISGEPLFARRAPHAPWRPAAVHPVALPGVAAFQESFIKIPAWGYPGDEDLTEGYRTALAKVSEHVAR
ncbi:aminotransferase class I/II-fold pyridoxal phosphate-dependent enzyme [Streptomyces sp. NPDC050988]|uniref:aminotransferase class I/II-fold pyridoxal phosphate-dependent enzyme n=1 Tax=Streptomyces sp. NPDC050988 TaxID=3365637 RepID=UPI0037B561C5